MEVYIETTKLLLRRITADDAWNLFELDSDPEVVRYANPGGRTSSREEIRDHVLPRFLAYYKKYDGYGFYAAEEKASGEFVGWFSLRPQPVNGRMPDDFDEVELGFRLKKSVWGQGYATEGARALLEKGFASLATERVISDVIAANTASIRVLQKVGLVFEESFVGEDDGQEEVRYALTRGEYMAEREARRDR